MFENIIWKISTCCKPQFIDAQYYDFLIFYLNWINFILFILNLILYFGKFTKNVGKKKRLYLIFIFVISFFTVLPTLYQGVQIFFYFFCCGLYPWVMVLVFSCSALYQIKIRQHSIDENEGNSSLTCESTNAARLNFLLNRGSRSTSVLISNILGRSNEAVPTVQNVPAFNPIQPSNNSIQAPSSESSRVGNLIQSPEHPQLLRTNFLENPLAVLNQTGNLPREINQTIGKTIQSDRMRSLSFSIFSNCSNLRLDPPEASRDSNYFPCKRDLTLNACQSAHCFGDAQTVMLGNLEQSTFILDQHRPSSSNTIGPSIAFNQPDYNMESRTTTVEMPYTPLFSNNVFRERSVSNDQPVTSSSNIVGPSTVFNQPDYNTESRTTTVELPYDPLFSNNVLRERSVSKDQPGTSSGSRNVTDGMSKNMRMNVNQKLIGSSSGVTASERVRNKRDDTDNQGSSLLSRYFLRNRSSGVRQADNFSGASTSEYKGSETMTSNSMPSTENTGGTRTTERKNPAKKKTRKTNTVNYHPPKRRQRRY